MVYITCTQVLAVFKISNYSCVAFFLKRSVVPGGGVGTHIYFSARGRAAEQGIIFRIPTPGQGIIFVKIGSMTGSIFVIFDSERSF